MAEKHYVKLLKHPRIARAIFALGVGAISYATMKFFVNDAWCRGAEMTLNAMANCGYEDQVNEFMDSAVMQ